MQIEELLKKELSKRLAGPVAESAGLGIDEENPDYRQYARFQEAAGLFSKPEREAGPGIRKEKISAGKEIPVKKDFVPGPLPEVTTGASVRKYGADVMAVIAVRYAAAHPDCDMAKLTRMDRWLSADGDADNLVPRLIGLGLEDEFLTKAEALGFINEEATTTPSTPAANGKPTKPKRVMFSDQPGVIPRDETKHKEAGEKYVHIDDVIEPTRNMMSHMSVIYVDRLVRIMSKLKASNDPKKLQFVIDLRSLAEESLLADTVKACEIRERIMSILDNMYDGVDKQALGTRARKRNEMILSLPYVKAGLLDADEAVIGYERRLEDAVISCLTPLIGKAQRRPVYKYMEADRMTRDQAEEVFKSTRSSVRRRDAQGGSGYLVPSTPRRGIPSTQDILKEISFATKPYHQAMEADLSSQLSFCKSLALVDDPRTMLALRSRMNKEKKRG